MRFGLGAAVSGRCSCPRWPAGRRGAGEVGVAEELGNRLLPDWPHSLPHVAARKPALRARRDRRVGHRNFHTLTGMNSIDFAELNPQDANSWLAFVRESHEAQLTELANWMDLDSGPTRLADGSWGSLEHIWAWALKFVERGGASILGEQVRPSSVAKAFGLDVEGGPIGPMAENLMHYIFEAFHSMDDTTHWAIFPASRPGSRVVDIHHQETGISIGSAWVPVESNLPSLISQALRGRPDAVASTGLQNLLVYLVPEIINRPSRSGPSILQPRVGKEVFQPPVPLLQNSNQLLNEAHTTTHNPVLLLAQGAKRNALTRGQGMPIEELKKFLSHYDFEFDESTGSSSLEHQSVFFGWLYARGVALEVFAKGDQIGGVLVRPLRVTNQEWAEFCSGLEQFAERIGGTTYDER